MVDESAELPAPLDAHEERPVVLTRAEAEALGVLLDKALFETAVEFDVSAEDRMQWWRITRARLESAFPASEG